MSETKTPAQPRPHLAVYPGSFDPLTYGHLDLITRAASIFDHVIVGIAYNGAKIGRYHFPPEQRQELAAQATSHLPNVSVELIPGLLADYCRERGARAIIKGLRNGTDLDAETPMALVNRQLGGPDTLFLTAAPTHAHVSSSLVKDVARNGGDVTALVPPVIAEALAASFGEPQATGATPPSAIH